MALWLVRWSGIFPALDGEEELELLDGKEEEGGNTGVLQTEF